MIDILLTDAVSCLSNISRSNIDLHPHYRVRSIQRHILDRWIYDCLINKEIVGILKQSDDKFRLYYEHPTRSNTHDLIVIIVIDDLITDVTVITSYEQKNKQRVR